MHKHILWLLIAASTMTGCASGRTQTGVSLTAPESDKALCQDPLPQPKSGKTQDLLANHVVATKAYYQCADRHRGLVEWLEATEAR